MIIYVKLSVDDEVKQFTTALEAKEYIAENFQNSVSITIQDEPVENIDDLEFLDYDNIDAVKEAIDIAVSEFGKKDENEEDSGETQP